MKRLLLTSLFLAFATIGFAKKKPNTDWELKYDTITGPGDMAKLKFYVSSELILTNNNRPSQVVVSKKGKPAVIKNIQIHIDEYRVGKFVSWDSVYMALPPLYDYYGRTIPQGQYVRRIWIKFKFKKESKEVVVPFHLSMSCGKWLFINDQTFYTYGTDLKKPIPQGTGFYSVEGLAQIQIKAKFPPGMIQTEDQKFK